MPLALHIRIPYVWRDAFYSGSLVLLPPLYPRHIAWQRKEEGALFERGKGKGGERWKKASPILHRSPLSPFSRVFFRGRCAQPFPSSSIFLFRGDIFCVTFFFLPAFRRKGSLAP